MRRTANTSVSPTIGMVVTGTGKIGFGPACASAPPFCAAAPASASAPVASIVLRSTVTIVILLFSAFLGDVSRPAAPVRQLRVDQASARLLEMEGTSHSQYWGATPR